MPPDVGGMFEQKTPNQQVNGLRLHQGRFRLEIRKNFFIEIVFQALEHAAQGSGGVPIPGGVQKTWRGGTSGHGLAGMMGLG